MVEGDSEMKYEEKIPDSWGNGHIIDFFVLQRGFDITEKQAVKGRIPVISSSGFSYFHNEAKVSAPGIVTGRKGKIGKVFYIEEDFWPHDTTLWVKDFKGNYPEYIQIFLQYLKLERFDEASSIPTLNRNYVHKQKCIFPPLPEQKAIADLLSTWDEAIAKTEKLIQAKEKRFRQTTKHLLFGHKRINKQHEELVDSHFFKYPCDWNLVKIGKIAKEISDRNGESDATVLSCSKYDGFVNSLDYFGKQVFSSDTSNYKVIKKSQFGYPSNHIEEGSIGLLEHCKKGIVSPIYVIFEASPTKVHPVYLFKLLKTDIYKHIFQVKTSSSVDRRGSLRWGEFSKIKIPLPLLEEQQQIAETLSTAQQEIDFLKQLAEKYKTQKRGLMQKMLTGEWRVKPEIVNQYLEA